MSAPPSLAAPSPPAAPAPSTPAAGAVATLHPAYFAMVMATGIVSIASHLLDHRATAISLFYLNVALYLILWILTALRLALYPRRLLDDLMSHGRSVGFFTTTAATCVLGSQFLVVGRMNGTAAGLWFFGIALWAVLTYSIFTIITAKSVKPALAEGIHGGWLVAVVAAQSVSVLGAQLAGWFNEPARPVVLFFCLTMWLGAGMLYIWIISLIFYRYAFFALRPSDLSPPYWINMGAVAISTLAGTMLVAAAPQWILLEALLPFIKGLTLLFWATATWWIPMLVILGLWRHGYMRFPLKYDPLYWGAVFPLGMYTACTVRMAQVMEGAGFLMQIPRGFIYIAWIAWAATFLGLLHHLFRSLRSAPAS